MKKRDLFVSGELLPNQGRGYFPENIRQLYHFQTSLVLGRVSV